MRKGHSIIGLPVLTQAEGTNLGKVLDLVFDQDANTCIGVMLREKSLLKSAQVVSWADIVTIGKDALMVSNGGVVADPSSLPNFRAVMDRDVHLAGTKIITESGDNLGTFDDVYIDDTTGRVVGYEVSGGFVADTMSGKRYVPADRTHEVRVGNDVLIASRDLSTEFERQEREEPGGLKPVLTSAGEKVSGAYDSAKDSVEQAYSNVAEASVEKQKELVIGKMAGRDVYLPAPTMAATDMIVEDNAPILADAAAHQEAHELQPEHGPLLVASGQIITAQHAHEAEATGILHQLLLSAGVGATDNALHSTSPEATPQNMASVIGHMARREVLLPDGSILVAPGMVVTSEIALTARQYHQESELIAATNSHSSAQTTATSTHDTAAQIGATATTMFDSLKQKVADMTGAAHEKKAGFDDAAQQKKINNALGRPTTRIILDRNDAVILNTGDIITHKAIERARDADMLDVLLDSVYDNTPTITPQRLALTEPGEAAIPQEMHPAGGPIIVEDSDSGSSSNSSDNQAPQNGQSQGGQSQS